MKIKAAAIGKPCRMPTLRRPLCNPAMRRNSRSMMIDEAVEPPLRHPYRTIAARDRKPSFLRLEPCKSPQ